MRAKTFTVPFAEIVGDEAAELEFGPDDYLVVRPIFGMSAENLRGWIKRITSVDPDAPDDVGDQIVLDLLEATCQEWHLDGPDGPIPQPKTPKALLALPGALHGSLFRFLTSYRGGWPNPTTRS